jgi:ferredoxin
VKRIYFCQGKKVSEKQAKGEDKTMSNADAYTALAERHGYKDSPRYRAVLEYLLTPLQAKLAVELPMPPEELADKMGMDLAELTKELDDLYDRGVIFPKNFQTKEHYRFARSVVQLHDASQSALSMDVVKDRDIYALWEEFCNVDWYPDVGTAYAERENPWARVIPAYQSIADLPDVLPHENIREMLKAQKLIAVCSCSCRKRAESMDNKCDKSHDENCLQFNRGAEYAISRGSGKELSIDEAIKLFDTTEEDGLVHSWQNTDAMTQTVMCNCCRDCCMNWVPIDRKGVSIGKHWVKSRYEAEVDDEECTGCETCVERCQFEAITMEDDLAVVDPEKCFGCGVCVLSCPTDALSMKVVRPPEHIPVAQPRK